jgi:2-aminoethylphosphonate-pyruvate transaminase
VADPAITHVGVVYSETGSGVIHDAPAIGAAVRAAGRRVIVDAVSAFGALPLDLSAQPEIDAVLFTSNKCIEALPGIAFAVARVDALAAPAGQAGSWSFDLGDVHARTEGGSFRFTPPAQVLAAFDRAMDFWEAEGRDARLARYTANMRTFYDGMVRLGLTPWLAAEYQGPIIVNIHAPNDPAWDLQRFVDALKRRGVLISNFYNTPTPSFRVGCIGAITPDDMRGAVAAMDAALGEIGVTKRENVRDEIRS